MDENLPKNLADCTVGFDGPDDSDRSIAVIPRGNKEYLSPKEQIDYHKKRKEFLQYLAKMGKVPDRMKGYSPYTVYAVGLRSAKFDLWTWKQEGYYQTPPSLEEARGYMKEVAERDVTEATKGKTQQALRLYSGWLQHKYDDEKWEFRWNFNSSGKSQSPRDYLTKKERKKVRKGALDKTTSNGKETWKFTSLVWAALDAGLRPVEISRARTSWVDVQNSILRIPREESSKNVGDWRTSIRQQTSDYLARWKEERAKKERYDDTDQLWLTRRGNKYSSKELSRLLRTICDNVGIDYSDRQMSFYAIRHSTGTYMADERGLKAAQSQLRHKDVKTTMKYDAAPVEERRDALDKMG